MSRRRFTRFKLRRSKTKRMRVSVRTWKREQVNRMSVDDSLFLFRLADYLNSLLAHGKGAAFVVSPASGILGPFETLTVDVTACNEMWGEYRDNLVCKVRCCLFNKIGFVNYV